VSSTSGPPYSILNGTVTVGPTGTGAVLSSTPSSISQSTNSAAYSTPGNSTPSMLGALGTGSSSFSTIPLTTATNLSSSHSCTLEQSVTSLTSGNSGAVTSLSSSSSFPYSAISTESTFSSVVSSPSVGTITPPYRIGHLLHATAPPPLRHQRTGFLRTEVKRFTITVKENGNKDLTKLMSMNQRIEDGIVDGFGEH